MSNFYKQSVRYSHRVALCIGIGNYRQSSRLPSLNYSVNDALTVAAILEHQHYGGFTVSRLVDEQKRQADGTFRNQNVTKRRIETGIQWLFEQAVDENTLLLIYFSGHAEQSGNRLLLLPSDASISDEGARYSRSIDFSFFNHFFENCKAGAVVVLLDACHSGASTSSVKNIVIRENLNLYIIGASLPSQSAYESRHLKHGVFTYYLLKAFQLQNTEQGWLNVRQIGDDVFKAIENSPWDQTVRVMSEISGDIPILRKGYKGEDLLTPKKLTFSEFIEKYITSKIASVWKSLKNFFRKSRRRKYKKVFLPIVFFLIVIGVITTLLLLKLFASSSALNIPILEAVAFGNTNTFAGVQGRIYGISFSPDSSKFVVGTDNGTIALFSYNPATNKSSEGWYPLGSPLRKQIGVKAISFSPNGNLIAVGYQGGQVDLFSTSNILETSQTLSAHSSDVEGLSFSPNSSSLATTSSDGKLEIWNVSDLHNITKKDILPDHRYSNVYYCITFLANNIVAVGNKDGQILIWNTENNSLLKVIQAHTGVWTYWLSPSPQTAKFPNLLVSTSGYSKNSIPNSNQKGEIKLLNLDDYITVPIKVTPSIGGNYDLGKVLKEASYTLDDNNLWTYSTSFSPDGVFVAGAQQDGNVRIWETVAGNKIQTLKVGSSTKPTQATAVAFSPSGKWLVAGNDLGELKIWSVKNSY